MARCAIITFSAAAALAATAGSAAAQSGVRAGVLDCRGAPSVGMVIGSNRRLECLFHSETGAVHHYVGLVRRVGLDLGYSQASAVGWAVLAPVRRIGPGGLAGSFGGVSAGAAVGVGGNANALVGGPGNTLTLQPVSFESQTGVNVAVGLVGLELEPAPPLRGWHRHGRHRR